MESDVCVLLLGSGAAWEQRALAALEERQGVILLRRCMDVTDLLAVAESGQAQAAVVALEAPGLDTDAVDRLRRNGVITLVVLPDHGGEEAPGRARRIGAAGALTTAELGALGDVVLRETAAASTETTEPEGLSAGPATRSATRLGPMTAPGEGRVIAVWGPTGAPGRTTVALAVAGELAARGLDPLVVDVDPYGGAVAQHLGVLDEVSGLLSAARIAASGELPGRFLGLQRRVAGLRVLTGLPRADRWVEVRAETVAEILALGRRQGDVIVDTGFCLEEDPAADFTGRTGRNAITLDALREADDVVVVGAADPVGLSRLARGLVELREVTGGRAVHVVVNRMRSSLGWSEDEVAHMVQGFAPLLSLGFLPEDRAATDRALAGGRTLQETGDSSLAHGVAAIVDGLRPHSRTGRRISRRTAGRGRRR